MPHTKPAKFIVIEALDAGGSQTQTDKLTKRLKREKYDVLQLHFPQEDRATGRLIYDKFLLKKNEYPFSRREQALLYIQDFYSRVEDIRSMLDNLKNKKKAVVSDRFYSSTMAYQTIGLSGKRYREMMDWLHWLCLEEKPRLPKPDLVIFLDTPVEVSLKRLTSKKKDYFETKERLSEIRASYLKLAEAEQWHKLNSVNHQGKERTRDDLHNAIWQIVEPRLR